MFSLKNFLGACSDMNFGFFQKTVGIKNLAILGQRDDCKNISWGTEGRGGDGLRVGLGDLRDLFQP